MEVILREDFAALGFIGDKVKVKGGYARNFLIPRGLAIESREDNTKQVMHHLVAINAKKVKMRSEAEKLAQDLKDKSLSFTLKSGDKGRIFGAVTNKDIEAALIKLGYTIDRRRIRLPEPLRRAGSFEVEIKLHAEVSINIPVTVKIELLEEAKPEAEASAAGDKPRRGSRGKRGNKVDGEGASEQTEQ
jgi:large subunit ribosomal protein L9